MYRRIIVPPFLVGSILSGSNTPSETKVFLDTEANDKDSTELDGTFERVQRTSLVHWDPSTRWLNCGCDNDAPTAYISMHSHALPAILTHCGERSSQYCVIMYNAMFSYIVYHHDIETCGGNYPPTGIQRRSPPP